MLLGGCALAAGLGSVTSNAETVTYSYDALGRLRASSVSGGADNGTSTAICYDPASNRERYVTAVSGAAACTSAAYPPSAPLPTPTPTPAA
jgi:YD repeat-containing protein